MTVHVEFRRGTSDAWTQVNPVLAVGEPGIETDSGLMKIGNGVTAWSNLPYVQLDGTKFIASPQIYVQASQPLNTPRRSVWFIAAADPATHTPTPPLPPFTGAVTFNSFGTLTFGGFSG